MAFFAPNNVTEFWETVLVIVICMQEREMDYKLFK